MNILTVENVAECQVVNLGDGQFPYYHIVAEIKRKQQQFYFEGKSFPTNTVLAVEVRFVENGKPVQRFYRINCVDDWLWLRGNANYTIVSVLLVDGDKCYVPIMD